MCSGVRRQCLIKAAPLGVFQGKDGSQSSPHLLPTRTSARLQVFGCPAGVRPSVPLQAHAGTREERKGQDARQHSSNSQPPPLGSFCSLLISPATSHLSPSTTAEPHLCRLQGILHIPLQSIGVERDGARGRRTSTALGRVSEPSSLNESKLLEQGKALSGRSEPRLT